MTKLLKIKWEEDGDVALNARKYLPALVSNYFELGREVLRGNPKPEELHPLRLATKRLRYTLELFKPCYGPGLKARLAELQALQQVLGDINDTVAGTRVLTGIWKTQSPELARVQGFLHERGQTKAREFRERWSNVFDAPGQERWWSTYLARQTRKPTRK